MRRPAQKDLLDEVRSLRERVRKLELRRNGWPIETHQFNTTTARSILGMPSSMSVDGGLITVHYHPDGDISLEGTISGNTSDLTGFVTLLNMYGADAAGNNFNYQPEKPATFVVPVHVASGTYATWAYVTVNFSGQVQFKERNPAGTWSGSFLMNLAPIRWTPLYVREELGAVRYLSGVRT